MRPGRRRLTLAGRAARSARTRQIYAVHTPITTRKSRGGTRRPLGLPKGTIGLMRLVAAGPHRASPGSAAAQGVPETVIAQIRARWASTWERSRLARSRSRSWPESLRSGEGVGEAETAPLRAEAHAQSSPTRPEKGYW